MDNISNAVNNINKIKYTVEDTRDDSELKEKHNILMEFTRNIKQTIPIDSNKRRDSEMVI